MNGNRLSATLQRKPINNVNSKFGSTEIGVYDESYE